MGASARLAEGSPASVLFRILSLMQTAPQFELKMKIRPVDIVVIILFLTALNWSIIRHKAEEEWKNSILKSIQKLEDEISQLQSEMNTLKPGHQFCF